MFIKQLSVFIENKEGSMEGVLKTLKERGIDIISLSLADTSDYGLLRMIVSNPEEGKQALKENGFTAKITEVLAIKLAHRIGQLQELLEAICEASINIEYMYALSTGKDDAAIVLKASNPEKAKELLEKKNVGIFKLDDIGK